jgi:lipid-A-disaccharide synthase
MDSLFPMETLSVMGIAEVLPRLPELIRRINQTAAYVRNSKPDILITIDSPDFCFRVAKKVREDAVKPLMIHYVAPTVWAWRPERAAKIAKLYDGLLCLFPFEPPYFEKEGMKAAFVGHPLMESGLGQGYGDAYRHRLQVPHDARICGLFFGSRRGELRRMGPVLSIAAATLRRTHKDIHFVAPTLPHMKDEVTQMLRGLPFAWKVVVPGEDGDEKPGVFAAMDMAMATSGTVGLELAVAGIPHIIGYRANPLTAAIIRRKVKVKYAHLANILLDRPAVPEFLQENCTPGNVETAARDLLESELSQNTQRQAFAQVRGMLEGIDKASASDRAADFILNLYYAGGGRNQRSLTGT